MDNTRFTQYRDPHAKSEKKEKGPANTYSLLDNCYYVTAAVIKGTTVDKLIAQTEIMQNRGGAFLDEISELFMAAGLSGNYKQCANLSQVEERVAELARGLKKKVGLQYDRSNGTAHMIVATYDPVEQQCSYKDYQVNSAGATWTQYNAEQEGVTVYRVFES